MSCESVLFALTEQNRKSIMQVVGDTLTWLFVQEKLSNLKKKIQPIMIFNLFYWNSQHLTNIEFVNKIMIPTNKIFVA